MLALRALAALAQRLRGRPVTDLPAHALKALRASVRISAEILAMTDGLAEGRMSHAALDSSVRQVEAAEGAIRAFIDACRQIANEAEAEKDRKEKARERRIRLLRDDPDRDDP